MGFGWNLWLTEKKMHRGREAKRQRVAFSASDSSNSWHFQVLIGIFSFPELRRNIDPKWLPWHPFGILASVPGRISKGESGNWTLVDLHARQHFRRRGYPLHPLHPLHLSVGFWVSDGTFLWFLSDLSRSPVVTIHPTWYRVKPKKHVILWLLKNATLRLHRSKKYIVHSTCHQGQSHAGITSIKNMVNDVNGCWVVWVMCETILAPIPLRNPFSSRFLFQGGEWYTHVT